MKKIFYFKKREPVPLMKAHKLTSLLIFDYLAIRFKKG